MYTLRIKLFLYKQSHGYPLLYYVVLVKSILSYLYKRIKKSNHRYFVRLNAGHGGFVSNYSKNEHGTTAAAVVTRTENNNLLLIR